MKCKIVVLSALVTFFSVSLSAEERTGNPGEVSVADTSLVYDLDEVVVVSQPKEMFLLRQQPLSSSVFTLKEFQKLGVRDLRDVSSFVPNFTMPGYGARLTPAMYVRGIGSRVNSPAVGIYVDGVPIVNKNAFNFHGYQTDRIDVLRGPQGTLYGLNNEGGLVRLYSRNPMQYQGSEIVLGGGTDMYRNVEIATYNKLNDRLAFSLAEFYTGHNGYFRNSFSNEKADKIDEGGARMRLVWTPTNRLSFDLIANYQHVKQNGFCYGEVDLATGKTADSYSNRLGFYRRDIANTGLNIKYSAKYFDFNSTSSYQYLRDYMLMDIDYRPLDYMHLEQHQLQNALTQEFVLKSNRPSRWQWTVGAFGSYQWLKTNAPVYFDDDFTSRIAQGIQTSMYNSMLNSMAQRMMAQGMQQEQAYAMAAQTIARAGGVSMEAEMEVPGKFRTPTLNLGFFHESNYFITPRLKATLGLRYDYSHVRIEYDTYAAMAMTAHVMGQTATNVLSSALVNRYSNDFSQLLPKFGLTYQIDERGSNVYATVSKGYRSGGFNIQMFSDILQTELDDPDYRAQANRQSVEIPHDDEAYERIRKTIEYDPETSWNYEAGAHLNLFGGQMQADFAAFYMQVSNQQLSVMAGNYGFGRMMVNAGKSYSCGIEAALRGNVFDNHLMWALSYGYTHAVFKEYEDEAVVDGVTQMMNYKDKRVPFVPEHTFAANADYRFDVTLLGLQSITLGLNVTGQGKIYWDEANNYEQDIYALLGAHIDAEWKNVCLSFWGRNLTDTNYNTFAVESTVLGNTKLFAQRGNPLQLGVELRWKF